MLKLGLSSLVMNSVGKCENTDSLTCEVVILPGDPLPDLISHGYRTVLALIVGASGDNDIGTALCIGNKLSFLNAGVICGHHLSV